MRIPIAQYARRLMPTILLASLVGCAETPDPPQVIEKTDLVGQPSWFSLGGSIYQERERFEAQKAVLEFGSYPCWFMPGGREVTKKEFEAYLAARRAAGEHISVSVPPKARYWLAESPKARYWLPEPVPYPERVDDLPVEDQGVRLDLAVRQGDEPDILEIFLTLRTSRRDVKREIEHRYTNVLPFLFAVFADGRAIAVPFKGWGRMGGINGWVDLVPKGQQKTWRLEVHTESLSRLLPEPAPKRVELVAVFYERQHQGFYPGFPRDLGTNLPLVSEGDLRVPRPLVLVRSPPAELARQQITEGE